MCYISRQHLISKIYQVLTHGDLADAMEWGNELLEQLPKAEGEEYKQATFALENIVAALVEQDRLRDAATLTEQVLSVQRRHSPPECLAKSLSNLGYFLRRLGKVDAANAALLEATNLAALLPPNDFFDRSTPFVNFAHLHLECGDDASAKALLLDAVRRRFADFGAWHPRLARTLVQLAEVYSKQGKVKLATAATQRAVRIFANAGSGIALASALTTLAYIYEKGGRFRDAKGWYLAAINAILSDGCESKRSAQIRQVIEGRLASLMID